MRQTAGVDRIVVLRCSTAQRQASAIEKVVFAIVDCLAAKLVLASTFVQVNAVTDTIADLVPLNAAAVWTLKLAGFVAFLACK